MYKETFTITNAQQIKDNLNFDHDIFKMTPQQNSK